MDSTQAWFCRDIWIEAARAGMGVVDQPNKPGSLPQDEKNVRKRDYQANERMAPRDEVVKAKDEVVKAKDEAVKAEDEAVKAEDAAQDDTGEMPKGPLNMPPKPGPGIQDADANAGSDYDAMPQNPNSPSPLEATEGPLNVPNSEFEPARIIINPRCVTTYAGVSHSKLANDLFGTDDGGVEEYDRANYLIEEWKAAPEYFICQEQQTTGGRKAPKNQRSSTFSIYERLTI